MSRIPTTLVLVAAAGALVLTATGGAVAGAMVTGAQIKDGTVSSADVRNKTLQVADLAPATVTKLRGKAGPAGQPGTPGAPGLVRGFAHVYDTFATRQSGGITVTNPDPGVFCVTVPGVSAADSVPVVSLDYANSSTSTGANASQAGIEVASLTCAPPAFGVRTFVHTFPNGGQPAVVPANQGFTILVP